MEPGKRTGSLSWGEETGVKCEGRSVLVTAEGQPGGDGPGLEAQYALVEEAEADSRKTQFLL